MNNFDEFEKDKSNSVAMPQFNAITKSRRFFLLNQLISIFASVTLQQTHPIDARNKLNPTRAEPTKNEWKKIEKQIKQILY